MRLLITGANGFVGSALCRYFDKKNIKYESFTGDLTNIKTFNKGKFDIVVHLAALITHSKHYSIKSLNNINVDGTRKLAVAYPSAKIVYISTVDVTKKPLTAYAATKLRAEELIKKNVRNLIIRLPSVFGPNQRQDKLIPRLIRYYYSGEDCIVNSDDIREYIYIDEVVNKIIKNFSKCGVITLQGFKMKNLRVKKMIGKIYSCNQFVTSKENRIFANQLKKCCIEYQKSKKYNIFFDLDGTILDVTEKYYRIYHDFLTKRGIRPVSKDTFWKFKRDKKNTDFLMKDGYLAEEYKVFFKNKIETADYLKYDRPFPFANDVLNKLKDSQYKLILITLRHNAKALIRQLNKYNLKKIFNLILIKKQNLIPGDNYKSKIQAIKAYAKTGDILVGDTKADIRCGEEIGLTTIGVLSGLNNKTGMNVLHPNYIIRSIKYLPSKLKIYENTVC